MQVRASRLPGYTAQQWDRHPVLPGTVAVTPAAAQQSPAEMQQLLHESLKQLKLYMKRSLQQNWGLSCCSNRASPQRHKQ